VVCEATRRSRTGPGSTITTSRAGASGSISRSFHDSPRGRARGRRLTVRRFVPSAPARCVPTVKHRLVSWVRRREVYAQDKLLGIAEMERAIREGKPQPLPPDFLLHLNELTLMIQRAGPEGATSTPTTTFAPLVLPGDLKADATRPRQPTRDRGSHMAGARSRLTRSLAGGSGERMRARVARSVLLLSRSAIDAAAARPALQSCDRVGRWTRTKGGVPKVSNRGRIEVGARVVFNSTYQPVSLSTGPDGTIDVGDGTYINFGCTIDAQSRVTIGRSVSLGPYCVVRDAQEETSQGEASAIEIGDRVWLAGRVTVLPGSRIGAGSVITAGSVVSGAIPDQVVAGGVPARVLRSLKDDPSVDGDSLRAAAGQVPGPVSDGASSSLAAPVEPVSEPPILPKAADVPALAQDAARPHSAIVISDFTVDDFAHRLSEDDGLRFDVEVAPFGQVVPSLLGLAERSIDLAVVWTLPDTVVPTFQKLVTGQAADFAELMEEVDAFAHLLVSSLETVRCAVVPTWTAPAYDRGLGAIDLKPGGVAHALLEINRRLIGRLAPYREIFVLDTQRWVAQAGAAARHPKLWYGGKVAYNSTVLAQAATDTRAAFAATIGAARKLLVVDLDDTLWGGIVGDIGWENLRLGGHDSLGEAFVGFQSALKGMQRRGILLAIASKNEEDVALEAIRSHSAMVLNEEDFAAHRINWRDKAANIVEIADQLNLGLQSVVFIDDNPVERARVRDSLPEVFVPEWPTDKHLYASTLLELTCFDQTSITNEDLKRNEMMSEERKRVRAASPVESIDDWVRSLNMRVRVAPVAPATLARTAQLLNKTNQMNLTTRRLTEGDVATWASEPDHDLFVIDVSDKFGEAGLTGIVSLESSGDVGTIVDYVLSCRVMGRRVEETLLSIVVRAAQRRGLDRVEAHFVPTAKNKPCLAFWNQSGFAVADQNTFTWDLDDDYPHPDGIELVLDGGIEE